MTTLSKILSTVAVAGLVGGCIIDFQGVYANNPALAAVLPLGAIAFGLFLIAFMLEGEVAKYDAEQATKKQPIQRNTDQPAPQKPDSATGLACFPKTNL